MNDTATTTASQLTVFVTGEFFFLIFFPHNYGEVVTQAAFSVCIVSSMGMNRPVTAATKNNDVIYVYSVHVDAVGFEPTLEGF